MRLISESDYIAHHGIKGQKWGIRRYRNADGTLTEAGKKKLSEYNDKAAKHLAKAIQMKRSGVKEVYVNTITGNNIVLRDTRKDKAISKEMQKAQKYIDKGIEFERKMREYNSKVIL